jgi:hypothetical protein
MNIAASGRAMLNRSSNPKQTKPNADGSARHK